MGAMRRARSRRCPVLAAPGVAVGADGGLARGGHPGLWSLPRRRVHEPRDRRAPDSRPGSRVLCAQVGVLDSAFLGAGDFIPCSSVETRVGANQQSAGVLPEGGAATPAGRPAGEAQSGRRADGGARLATPRPGKPVGNAFLPWFSVGALQGARSAAPPPGPLPAPTPRGRELGQVRAQGTGPAWPGPQRRGPVAVCPDVFPSEPRPGRGARAACPQPAW